jgi:hypothetical protein
MGASFGRVEPVHAVGVEISGPFRMRNDIARAGPDRPETSGHRATATLNGSSNTCLSEACRVACRAQD